MITISYAVAVVSMIAFVVLGYLLGYMTVRRTQGELMTPTTTSGTPKKRWIRPNRDSIVLLLVCLALLGAGVVTILGQRSEARRDNKDAHLIACLNAYADRLADSIESRSQASEDRQAAEARIFQVVFMARQSQPTTEAEKKAAAAEFDRALRAYVDADRRLKAQRAANPYPEPPREVCPGG